MYVRNSRHVTSKIPVSFAVAFFATCHVLVVVLTLYLTPYTAISSEFALRLDRVFSTGTSGSAGMIFLFVVGCGFYLGYLIVLKHSETTEQSQTCLVIIAVASAAINAILVSRVHIGGDVIRNISFAAAFLKGYNPYSIDGSQLNALIQNGRVTAPPVTEYLDHRFDYPPITLLYYSAMFILAHGTPGVYAAVLIGLTSLRFASGFLIYGICRRNGISHALPVALFWMNPLMIYSSYDGKEDILMVLFALLALYFVDVKKPVQSGISLALSALAKYVSAIYWPILAVYTRKISSAAMLTLAFLAVISAVSLPFLFSSPYVFSYVVWQSTRPCNSLLNLFCYDPAHPFSSARIVAAAGFAAIFTLLVSSLRKEEGFLRMTTVTTIATIGAIIFIRSFFIWYLEWLSVSVYFARDKKSIHYLLPLLLPLVALPSLLGP